MAEPTGPEQANLRLMRRRWRRFARANRGVVWAAVAVAGVAFWLGLAIAGTVTAAHCFGAGGVWSEEFEVCECANYGGRWEGAQCIRP